MKFHSAWRRRTSQLWSLCWCPNAQFYVYSLCLIAHLYGVLNRYYLLIALSARRSLLASPRTAKTSRMFVDSSIELGPGSGPKQAAEFFLVANIQASVSEYWNAVDWAWKKCWVCQWHSECEMWLQSDSRAGTGRGDKLDTAWAQSPKVTTAGTE